MSIYIDSLKNFIKVLFGEKNADKVYDKIKDKFRLTDQLYRDEIVEYLIKNKKKINEIFRATSKKTLHKNK